MSKVLKYGTNMVLAASMTTDEEKYLSENLVPVDN